MSKCNFKYSEVTTTNTGIKNDLPVEKMDNFMRSLIGLQAVRELLGVPMVINSWYRNSAVNKAVGGSSTSSHMEAEAIDFYPKCDLREAYNKIKSSNIKYDQLIIYPNRGFIHIGFGSRMRQQNLEK